MFSFSVPGIAKSKDSWVACSYKEKGRQRLSFCLCGSFLARFGGAPGLPAKSAGQADLLLAEDSRSSSRPGCMGGMRSGQRTALTRSLGQDRPGSATAWQHPRQCPVRSCSEHPSPTEGTWLCRESPSSPGNQWLL